MLTFTIPPTAGTERVFSLQLNTLFGSATLMSVYVPTLTSVSDEKDKFYDELSAAISSVPEHHSLYVLGDFNARVGSDHNSWPLVLGHFGVGRMSENGQRLLELGCHLNLFVTKTFFNTKPQHRVSSTHPRSKHWDQLDLILTRRPSLSSVRLTRTYQSADCDTDHSLVYSKVKWLNI